MLAAVERSIVREKALVPKSPGRSQRSRRESPGAAWTLRAGSRGQGATSREHQGGGMWQGRQGLQFFTEEASGGLASGRGRGEALPGQA